MELFNSPMFVRVSTKRVLCVQNISNYKNVLSSLLIFKFDISSFIIT